MYIQKVYKTIKGGLVLIDYLIILNNEDSLKLYIKNSNFSTKGIYLIEENYVIKNIVSL